MDLLAVLLGSSTLNVYRALAEDDKTKLFSKKIAGGSTLCWSPCGKFVCVGGAHGEIADISIFDVEGGHVERETELKGLVALDWVAASTSADFYNGAEQMVPLLAIPSLAAVLEECLPETTKESKEWGLLVAADNCSLAVNAQGTFPLAKLSVSSGEPVLSAKLSLDLRSLSVLRGDEIIVYSVRLLSVRRQELREIATLMQRADFVVNYLRRAVDVVQRCWNSAVEGWIKRVSALEHRYAGEDEDIHGDFTRWCSGKPSEAMRDFLNTSSEWGLAKTEKLIMQAMEYANMIITTRVFVGTQHLILHFRELKARMSASSYTNMGLTPSFVEHLQNLAEELLVALDVFLNDLRFEQTFAKALLNVMIRLSGQLGGTVSADYKELSRQEMDAFVTQMSDKHSLQFESIGKALAKDNKKSLVQVISRLANALQCQGKHIVDANSADISVLSAIPLPASRQDTSQKWFRNEDLKNHHELAITWIESENSGNAASLVRARVVPAANGGDIIMEKATLHGAGWTILLVRMYTLEEMVLVFSSQGVPFLCRLRVDELQFEVIRDCSEEVPHSVITLMDLELRQLPDGYMHTTDLRASPSRGVLSVFARKLQRLLTLDLEEEDEDPGKEEK